jgi:hypothetical protein
MLSPEFDHLAIKCEKLAQDLKVCTDPQRRRELLKEMKITLDAANEIAFDPVAPLSKSSAS